MTSMSGAHPEALETRMECTPCVSSTERDTSTNAPCVAETATLRFSPPSIWTKKWRLNGVKAEELCGVRTDSQREAALEFTGVGTIRKIEHLHRTAKVERLRLHGELHLRVGEVQQRDIAGGAEETVGVLDEDGAFVADAASAANAATANAVTSMNFMCPLLFACEVAAANRRGAYLLVA